MASLCVAAALRASAVTPDTQWQRIPLTNTIDQVAEEAKLVRAVDLAAPYDTNLAYNVGSAVVQTGQLYRCTTPVPAGTSWDQAFSSFARETPVGVFTNLPASKGSIAMFVVPVNDRVSTNTNQYFFAGFELKASTNNFGSVDEDVNL